MFETSGDKSLDQCEIKWLYFSITFFFPWVNLSTLDELNLQLSACGFSLHKDPDQNFVFRVSYTGCFVQQQVRPSPFNKMFDKNMQILYIWLFLLCLIMIVVWRDFSAQFPQTYAEFGEEDKSIWRQTSQFHNDMPRCFCTPQQRANPVWPRLHSGNCWLEIIVCPATFGDIGCFATLIWFYMSSGD